MIKIKLLLFKIKNFFIIFKSRILKKKINLKYRQAKKNFDNYISSKNFSQKWFLNNFDIFHHYLPKDLTTSFSYLEIGSFEGLSALNILYNYKNSKVTTIDLWSTSNINSEALEVNFNEVEKKFDENLEGYKFNKIKNDSVIALRELLRNKIFFDFIYIDGSHNGEDILCDAIESYKLLNIGGTIIFDDILNSNSNISIQSYSGFEKFCDIYKKDLKILYLKNIAVIKKIK
jgi:predicted O-methyltransferase YrrM|tara:strand:+ start:362 stop:1054 length:693 start_codon:yes stop_codon:yes gene_type:complete